jgi:ACT domain-containing protein
MCFVLFCFVFRRCLIAHRNIYSRLFYFCIASRPGMLAAISESLADKGLSIESIETDVQVGKNNGHNFIVNADCIATSYMDQDSVQAMVTDLGSLKEQLDLDIVDVRVQRLVKKQ